MPATSFPIALGELKEQPLDSFISSLVQTSLDSSLTKVIGLLKESDVYEIFLPETPRCGILSARDVLKTARIEETKASTLMSYVPVLPKDAVVGQVARVMADYRIRAVPISDGHKIIGQVNCASLLNLLKGKMGSDTRITSIATSSPITVAPDSSVATAKELMIRKRIDHLPVTREKHLSGILTSGNIVSWLTPAERIGSKSMSPQTRRSLDFPVGEAMEPNPLTCSPETSAEQALDSMLSTGRSCILVTQWEELQGIATYRDFMTLLAEAEPEAEIPIFIVGLPDDPFEAETAKTKFKRTVNQLHRVFPDILEARSVIKSKFSRPGKERGRYEVSVNIRTAGDTYTYSGEGWDLPVVYDLITDRLKRLMTQKHGRRRTRERERPGT